VITRAKALSVELGTPITPGFEALVFKASRGIEDIYELIRIPLEFCASAKRASQARRLNGRDFAQFFCGIRITYIRKDGSRFPAILDPTTHIVTLVNAGHPPPLIYHRATRTVAQAISTEVAGLPLGVSDGLAYPSCQVSLEPGDSILAFTDGVTDAMNIQECQLETKGVYDALEGGQLFAPAISRAGGQGRQAIRHRPQSE
jgi:hypothetical protein